MSLGTGSYDSRFNCMKKIVIVSAINIYVGGPLTILKECVDALERDFADDFRIIVLVHKKELIGNEKVEIIEFERSRRSWLFRLYYEYIYFWFFSLKVKPYLWLSLHDITPNVSSKYKAVYCHNASMFYKMREWEKRFDRTFALFNRFYGYLYGINIKKNDYLIVQQDWLRTEFEQKYGINNVIVALPVTEQSELSGNLSANNSKHSGKFSFFYPSLARTFKNFEILGDAVKLLGERGIDNFEINLTVDGSENLYASHIVEKYDSLAPMKFLGLQTKNGVNDLYKKADYLIFPSKLETWGLPITEFKRYDKPMFVADVNYAKETVGDYKKVNFFDPDDAGQLAELMAKAIKGVPSPYDKTSAVNYKEPFVKSWNELFKFLFGRFQD